MACKYIYKQPLYNITLESLHNIPLHKQPLHNITLLKFMVSIQSERHGTRLQVFNERNPTHIHV